MVIEFKMDAIFIDFPEPMICSSCKRTLDEGYFLHPSSDEENDNLHVVFDDNQSHYDYTWIMGECCFGGYCGVKGASTPNDFYREVIIKKTNLFFWANPDF